MKDMYQVAYWKREEDNSSSWLEGSLVPVVMTRGILQARHDAKKTSMYDYVDDLFGVTVYQYTGQTWIAVETYVKGELVS